VFVSNGDILKKSEAPASGVVATRSGASPIEGPYLTWRKVKRGSLFLFLALLLVFLGYLCGRLYPPFNGEGAVSRLVPLPGGLGKQNQTIAPREGIVTAKVDEPTALYLNRPESQAPSVAVPDSGSSPSLSITSSTLELDPPNDKELALYQETVRGRPNDPYAHRNLGVALFRMGEIDRAIAEFKTYVALAPNDPSARNDLGVALYTKGQQQAALQQFREATKLDPSGETYASSNKKRAEFEGELYNAKKTMDSAGKSAATLPAMRAAPSTMPASPPPRE
jgi:Flp pilus assembly protein TadD